MEKIIAINKIVEGKDYEAMEGFEVITNKQKIKLLIDNHQECCEKFGYFWCNDDEKEFIGAELLDVVLTDEALKEVMLKDRDIYRKNKYFEGGVMFVDLKTSEGVLQFVAYNEHNGCYGHDATVSCEQLEHTEVL